MFYKLHTNLGDISFNRLVLVSIIKYELDKYNGVVFLSNKKGKIEKDQEKTDYYSEDGNFVDYTINGNNLELNIYIVLKIGTSINGITSEILPNLKNKIEEYLNVNITNITIHIAGMLAKRVSRRTIEVKL